MINVCSNRSGFILGFGFRRRRCGSGEDINYSYSVYSDGTTYQEPFVDSVAPINIQVYNGETIFYDGVPAVYGIPSFYKEPKTGDIYNDAVLIGNRSPITGIFTGINGWVLIDDVYPPDFDNMIIDNGLLVLFEYQLIEDI